MEAIRSFLYVDRTLKCPLFLFFFYLGLSLMQSTFYSFFNYSENQIIWTSEGWVVKTASMRSTLKINKEKKLFVFLNHYSVKKKIHVFQLQNRNFSPYFFFLQSSLSVRPPSSSPYARPGLTGVDRRSFLHDLYFWPISGGLYLH